MSGSALQRVPLEDRRWRALVDRCAAATPFHDPEWAGVLGDAYRYPAFALALAAPDGSLTAGLPFLQVRTPALRRRWISLPFTDECPVLAVDAPAEAELLDRLPSSAAALGAPATEIRAAVDAPAWINRREAVIHVLELDADLDAVRRRFSRSQVVRNISRAERDGVAVRSAASPADLAAFYALHTRTRRRQGVPVQPRRFFELLWSRIVVAGRGSILLAGRDGHDVAGALFLHAHGTTIYKFGASDPEGWPLRPNHAIFWTAIRAAVARGDRRFDFGRTDFSNGGLRAFKSGWGAAERPLVYSELDAALLGSEHGPAGRALTTAIQRGPKWLCRGLGTALYRYAGAR